MVPREIVARITGRYSHRVRTGGLLFKRETIGFEQLSAALIGKQFALREFVPKVEMPIHSLSLL